MNITKARIAYLPNSTCQITDSAQADLANLLEKLQDLNDVVGVFTNANESSFFTE